MIENRIAVYLGILNQGEISVELSSWVNKVMLNSPYPMFVNYSAEKPISYNRNTIVKKFLEQKEYDYLMMIDSDIVPPDNYLNLIDFQKDIISGLCFAFTKRNIFPLICKYSKSKVEGNKYRPYDSIHPKKWTGLVECDAVGTGAMIISRKVIEAIPYPFRNEYDKKDGEKLIGLDLNFCHRAKKLGFKVFCHTDYMCSHFTRMDLKGTYFTISKIFEDMEVLQKENKKLKNEINKWKPNSRRNAKKVKGKGIDNLGNSGGERNNNLSETERGDVKEGGSGIKTDISGQENIS
ncbi:MAG: hypothetical protein AABY22_35090 [Nanoarchaeota archaeon]